MECGTGKDPKEAQCVGNASKTLTEISEVSMVDQHFDFEIDF